MPPDLNLDILSWDRLLTAFYAICLLVITAITVAERYLKKIRGDAETQAVVAQTLEAVSNVYGSMIKTMNEEILDLRRELAKLEEKLNRCPNPACPYKK